VKRGFGQFKAAVREKSLLSAEERALVKAFQQGEEAGRSDEPRRCPYMPSAEQEKAEAWLSGYDEQAERYTVAPSCRSRHSPTTSPGASAAARCSGRVGAGSERSACAMSRSASRGAVTRRGRR
jgi:hypothetical protein